MSQFNQSLNPQNLIVDILGDKVHTRNISSQMLETIKGMGASQRAFGADVVWMFECANDDELVQTLRELNRLGFLFVGSPSGWPAADVFSDLLEKKNLKDKFKEVRWRKPGDWYIIER